MGKKQTRPEATMPKIVMAKLTELKPSGYNPRDATDDERTEVRKSLSKFGMVEPLVVNRHPKRNGILVGGHLRAEMAAELGIKEVPTVEVRLTERREKELSLRLNRTGEWDWERLATEFSRAELEAAGFDYDYMEGKQARHTKASYIVGMSVPPPLMEAVAGAIRDQWFGNCAG